MTGPMLRRDLLRTGTTEEEIRRRLRAREWIAVRPGAYLECADRRLRDAAARHTALTEATMAGLAPGAVVAAVSAAVRHGLPVWGVSLRTVHVIRDRSAGGRTGRRLRVHVAPVPPDDIVVVDGLPTTSVARTVVDVARTAPFETAVAVADAALHGGHATAEELADALTAAFGRRGVAAARAVLRFADTLADGPGESRSRVRMALYGVATPVLQHQIVDGDGLHIGYVDFWWPRHGIVGEFDGMEKYGRSLRPGESIADAVLREKRREDALRAQPHVRTVVRWTWSEIDAFDAVALRLPRT